MIRIEHKSDKVYYKMMSRKYQMSAGQKRILYMLTTLLRMNIFSHIGSSLMLIDDSEMFLHSYIQTHIYEMLRELMPEDSQIIMTTHSPTIFGSKFNYTFDLFENDNNAVQ